MDLKIAIVDDAPEDRKRLEADVQAWFASADADGVSGIAVETYTGGKPLLEDYSAGAFHLVFLDIRMEELDGITIARQLRAMDTRVLIVFLTASREFAFDAFPVHPFDYLVKPCDPHRLSQVLDEALRVLSAVQPEIILKVPRGEYHLPFDQLVAAVSQGHAVDVYTSDGQILRCIQTFSGIQGTLLKEDRFLLCNRGVLVNMDYVSALDGENVRLRNGQSFSLRVRGRGDIVARFSQYQFDKMKRGARP